MVHSCPHQICKLVALHLYHETKVYGCFIDASKAFDRVSHNTLFNILEKRGVPHLLLRFLWSWYIDDLLFDLKKSGVGCYWNHRFVGAV